MQRTHGRIGFALAAALAVGVLAGGPALAANTRTVFFGSPGTSSTLPPGLGVLKTTDVTAGGATATDVILQNMSPSQLTHVVIQGGGAAPDPLANPSFPAPSPICPTGATSSTQCIPSLPPGTTYAAVYVDPSSTAATTCSFTSTSLTCNVANMSPNQFARIRIILQPPTTAGSSVQFWLATDLKEGTSNTGSNQDTFFAYGAFNVLQVSCAEVANFFQAGAQPQLSNANTTNCFQTTNVSSNGTFNQGAFTSVGTSSSVLYCAPGITSCFGELSQANVNFGVNPNGYVLWDIVWTGADLPSAKPKGVTHFLDGYDPVKNPNAFVNISFKPTNQCSTATQTNCWENTFSTKTSFEAIFRTPNNGFVRGF